MMHGGSSGLRFNNGLFIKLSQSGWGSMLCLWFGPPWFDLLFSLTLAGGVCRISQEYTHFFVSS